MSDVRAREEGYTLRHRDPVGLSLPHQLQHRRLGSCLGYKTLRTQDILCAGSVSKPWSLYVSIQGESAKQVEMPTLRSPLLHFPCRPFFVPVIRDDILKGFVKR